jgi:hypothetical protein
MFRAFWAFLLMTDEEALATNQSARPSYPNEGAND